MNPALISAGLGIAGSLFGGTGSEKQTQKLPEENREANRVLLNRAVNMGQMPFMPFTGDVIAGFSPLQLAAMQNTGSAANAFGLASAAPQTTGNLSSIGLFDQAIARARERAPAAMNYYDSFFIDPLTGDFGSRTSPYEFIGSKPKGFGSYVPGRQTGPFGPMANLGFGAPVTQRSAMQDALGSFFGGR